jgi:hypothetical protein
MVIMFVHKKYTRRRKQQKDGEGRIMKKDEMGRRYSTDGEIRYACRDLREASKT